MIKASYSDKAQIVEILCESFDSNKSVNFVVKQDKKRHDRIRKLMEYSFELCFKYGEIYLTEDRRGCALTLFPDRKRTTIRTILLDLKLAYYSIGLNRIFKVLKRESVIKSNYPSKEVLYLWFIGVSPKAQRKGLGKQILWEIINKSKLLKKPIYLETSMMENLSFYKNSGFEVYNELNKPHHLFLIRRDPN